jgi:ATP-dependent DNA ligase
MLAKSAKGIPDPAKYDDGLLYEPKWDGFRCIIFRDGDEVELGSRNERPLTRYFPEVVEAVKQNLPERCVVDGEIVVAMDGRLQFEVLQERIHPAASRVQKLSVETPASYVAFDLLAIEVESLMETPLGERRTRLEAALADAAAPIHLTPATQDTTTAAEWFDSFEGAGLDGIVAKPRAGVYEPNGRAMIKVKHERTCDAVVAGYRLHKTSTEEEPLLGSLLLGLYDAEGRLQHIGVSAAFAKARRAELVKELEPLLVDPKDHPWRQWAEAEAHAAGRLPGAVSRWNAKKDLSWIPVDPVLVVEVGYDHMEGTRLRHTAQFKRWRTDRTPESCTYDQLEEVVGYDLAEIFSPS